MPSVSIGKAWSPMLALVPGDILQNQGANPVLVSSAIPPSQNEAVELQPFERIVVQAAVEVRLATAGNFLGRVNVISGLPIGNGASSANVDVVARQAAAIAAGKADTTQEKTLASASVVSGRLILTRVDGTTIEVDLPAGGAALAAPAVIAAPTIAGGTTEGSILTRTAGDASGNPAPARETVWLLDGVAIAGQTGNTLDTTGRVGVITTQDIWTNSEGTATGTSDAVTTTLAQPDPIVIAARAYPTGFGTLTYDISAQIPGAANSTGWAVSGPNAITIADGVLSFNSDAIQPGALTLTGRAEGADNEAWTLAVTFEAIAFSYDGADSVIVSYPADTPADGSIGFTPTGGEQDGRAITFTPADLDGLADGAGFAALAPLVSIAADGGTAGSVDAGDTIALDTPALYLYGGTEPTISYSAHDDGGVVEADITFPWTAPSGMSGSLSIVADDGFGNTAASVAIPIVSGGGDLPATFTTFESQPDGTDIKAMSDATGRNWSNNYNQSSTFFTVQNGYLRNVYGVAVPYFVYPSDAATNGARVQYRMPAIAADWDIWTNSQGGMGPAIQIGTTTETRGGYYVKILATTLQIQLWKRVENPSLHVQLGSGTTLTGTYLGTDVVIGLYRDGGDVVVTLNGTEDFRVTDNATELAGNLRSGIFGKNDVKTEKYAVDFGMTAFNVGV